MADIYIHRIDCTEKNILKLLDMFTFKNMIVEISDVKKSDAIFEKIKGLAFRHTTSIGDESSYFDVVLMADVEQFKEFVKYILESDSEFFAITSIDNEIQWEQYLYNRVSTRKLIKQGKVDISMGVAIQESTIAITLSKEAYDKSGLAQKTKEIKKIF